MFCFSLFDTPSQRYCKSRENIRQAIPVQIGITPFHFKRDDNIYTAKPYIFYVIPNNFSFIDRPFVCTSSSLSFLCDYKFDFNKVFIRYILQKNLHLILVCLSRNTIFK